MKRGCSIFFFFTLNSGNLLCRSTDISKYFRESLGLRDNESTGVVDFYDYLLSLSKAGDIVLVLSVCLFVH